MIDAVTAAVAREEQADARAISRCDTHLSVVLLCGERAYKAERAVAYAFVDHRSLAARRRTQDAALRRNRALADDIYLRVRSVVSDVDGFRFSAEDDPGAIEYVLEMRRFDPRSTLADRLARGEIPQRDVDRIAARLSEFHAGARRVAAPAAASPAVARVAAAIDANVDELSGVLPGERDRVAIDRIRRRLHAYLRDHAELIAARNREGCVRELHGDLRADHVLVDPDRIRVVDAIEFSRELAEVDVADELAFLASDLEARDARPTATRLLDAYRAHGGDPGPARLRAFYGVHRTCVRSKVAALRDGGTTAGSLVECRRLLALAERISWRTLGPRAYVVCGLSGSGKSRLADALAARAGIEVVAADRVRKARAGLEPTARAPIELYEPSVTERTYRELGVRAAAALAAGDSVVIDATCLARSHRATLLGALRGHRRQAWFVRCEAPLDVLRDRVAGRADDPSRVSDATIEILEQQRPVAEPLDEVPAERAITVRTDMPVDRIVDRIAALLDASGPGTEDGG